MPADISRLVHH